MFRHFLFVLVCFCALGVNAQDAYLDSLKSYQQTYIHDLFEIIKEDTAHIAFYPANRKLVVKAAVKLLPEEKSFKMTTSSGKKKEARKYALLTFHIDGKPFRLYTYQLLALTAKEETAQHLFLPFIDKTSGKESYGGGRYIDLEITDIRNNEVVIDFNKAYNPYCAFTTGYNCPIPPRENALPVAIKAGERYQKSKFKH